jgi:hypothetical protein
VGQKLLVLLPPPKVLISKAAFSIFVLEADFGTAFRCSLLVK